MTLSKRVMGGLLLLVVVLGAALRVESVRRRPHETYDELRYQYLSAVAMHVGAAGLRRDSARYLPGGPAAGFDVPSADRVGFVYTLGAFEALFRLGGISAGQWFSTWCDVAVLALLALGVWRVAGPVQALVASALYATNPAVLLMARHGWQESFVALSGLAMLLFAAAALRGRSECAAALGLLAGMGLVVKSTLFLSGVLLCVMVLFALLRRRLPGVRALLIAFLAAAGLAVAWLAAVLGGVARIGFFFNGERMQLNPYTMVWQTGTPLQWASGVIQLEPFTVCLAVVCTVWVVAECVRRCEPWVSLTTLAVLVAAVALLLPLAAEHGKNLRFAVLAFAPMCLLAGEATARLAAVLAKHLRGVQRQVAGAVALMYLLFAAGYGVWQFRTELEQKDQPDLSIRYFV
jgi:hypothetical protein